MPASESSGSYTKYVDKVADAWGEGPPDAAKGFYGFPPIRRHFQRLLTGEDEFAPRDWYERWVVREHLADEIPFDRCLSLACGFGENERILADLGLFQECVGIDISKGAIEGAREAACSEGYTGLEYQVGDLNQIEIELETYDLVWSNGALHHLLEVEHVIEEVYGALRPGGLLVANEYVGPNHWRLPARQRQLINAIIHILPDHLKQRTEERFRPQWSLGAAWRRYAYYALQLLTGRGPETAVKDEWPSWKKTAARLYNRVARRPREGDEASFRFGKVWDRPAHYFERIDPSEAVRSEEIIPHVQRRFDDVEVHPYEGSLLLYALDEAFYENFDPEAPADRALLEALLSLEHSLVQSGEVPSDHAHIVARKTEN